MPTPRLAQWVGRGERSAIGVHGFAQGGLIVEGGKLDPDAVSPLLLGHDFPEPWHVVLVIPSQLQGISGQRERDAFARMPAIPAAASGRMCRHVLLGLIPALLEHDLDDFGRALYELQLAVGECFAQAQGGVYGDPLLERIVGFVRSRGIQGVGQSSWGPTLYAFTRDEHEALRLADAIRREFPLSPGEVFITNAQNCGASVHKTLGNAV
jgi:beta-RFAP synthase